MDAVAKVFLREAVTRMPTWEKQSEPWKAWVESYPEETLLRVRINERTVLLDRLSKAEALLARSSPEGLNKVAGRHLEMHRYDP